MNDKLDLKESSGGAPQPESPEVTRDREAGLVFDFPAGAANREIDASRIVRLAENFSSEVSVPVRINNAVITGDLVLPGALFRRGFTVTGSVFAGRVNLARSTFEGGLDLRGSRFERWADFGAVCVKGDCDLTLAEFARSCRFDDARVEGSLTAAGALFQRVTFRRADIAKQIVMTPASAGALTPARFVGAADFSDARVGGSAYFDGAQFQKGAVFRHIHINGSASFRCHAGIPERPEPATPAPALAAVFGGKLSFARAAIEGKVSFEGAQFHGEVDFQRARISNTTDFSSFADGDSKRLLSCTRFLGEADFTACQIAGGAAFLGVYFKQSARFERLQVGGHLLFKPYETADGPVYTLFEGEANFLCARVRNNAEFDGVCFRGPATFDHLEVERNVYFRPAFSGGDVCCYAQFFGGADFIGVRVGGDAEFTGAKFWESVRLESIHIEGNAFFDDEYDPFTEGVKKVTPVIFAGDVHLVSAHFKHRTKFNGARFFGPAKFTSADFEGAAIFNGAEFGSAADFTGSRFGQHAEFKDSTFGGAADFTSVQINGAAFFNNAMFLGRTSFLAANFKSLEFKIRKPPTGGPNFGGELDLSGFTYELIDINEDLLVDIFAGMKEYNRQSFTQLERVLRSIGQDDWADDTYLYRRARERAEKRKRREEDFRKIAPHGWRAEHDDDAARRWANGVTGLFFDYAQSWVGNYGIRPFRRLLAISLGVLAVGTLMFWRPGAVVPRDRDAKISYAVRHNDKGEQVAVLAEPAATPTPVQLGFTQAVGVSFNQFIPIVQIPSGSKWKPSETLIPLPFNWKFDYFSYAMYGTIHSLLGAVLVPLGVAALTGVLHRREKPGK